MTFLLWIGILAAVSGATYCLFKILENKINEIPYGYEDETGFHYLNGDKDGTNQ
jgi:hypothetical protein